MPATAPALSSQVPLTPGLGDEDTEAPGAARHLAGVQQSCGSA